MDDRMKVRDFRRRCKCGHSKFKLHSFSENTISFNVEATCVKCGRNFRFSAFGNECRPILRKAIDKKENVSMVPKLGSTTMERFIITTKSHGPIEVAVPCGYCPLAASTK